MNRAQLIETNLVAKRVATTTQDILNARAAQEFADEGTAPSWKSADFQASANMTTAGAIVTDDAELLAWVRHNYPTEVETIVQIRPAFRAALIDRATQFGADACLPLDSDGTTVIPGMTWREGGQFSHISVSAKAPLKARLDELAAAVLDGYSPLALPSSFAPDAIEPAEVAA